MKYSAETPPNSNIFKQAIIKSLNENKQLIFSKKLTISQNSSEFPLVEISDIKDIIDIPDTNGKLTGIICFFDNRTLFIEEMNNSSNSYISVSLQYKIFRFFFQIYKIF